MKVLITGASGFVGQILGQSLLADGHSVIFTDIVPPTVPAKATNKENATTIQADLFEKPASVLSADLDAIYVLHGIMSSGSEADFELGYRVNLHSTLNLLEAVRKTCRPDIRVIYASSCATFGPPLPDLPSETTLQTPQGSYGIQKCMIELILNDYNRRGFINAFTVRLPSISVRGGKPTQAASAWMSSVISLPLQKKEAILPCADDFKCWLCAPKTLVKNLTLCLTLPKDCMEPHIRQVMLPGVVASVAEMMDALKAVGGEDVMQYVKREDPTPETKALLDSWPVQFDISKALKIGFVPDPGFRFAVQDYADTME
ncbi:hypothetical protein Golomagni_05831 [Golovinomyces magnicellulatus]|nr:hypothetical protein Golomagni_05831 [Golovinomyces magnicellulatus]